MMFVCIVEKRYKIKPPSFKINHKYSIRYVQIPYQNRVYRIFDNSVAVLDIPCLQNKILEILIAGIGCKMDTLEEFDLWKRFRKFEKRVREKNKILDKDD